MLRYVVYRLFVMVPTLVAISFLTFIIIQLPPGDYLSNQMAEMRASGQASGLENLEFLRREHALDRTWIEQYLIWLGAWPGPNGFSGLLQGNWGWSFEFQKPVADVVGEGLL